MRTVGIIGLGNIASGGNPGDKEAYCHAGGILHSQKVSLVAVADVSPTSRARFESVWGPLFPSLRYYESADAMLDSEALDIVAICVRGPDHYRMTMRALEAGPKLVFLEKPVSCSLEDMDSMVAMGGAKGIPITVSYSRHWSPKVLRLQELIRDGLIGEVKTVVGFGGGKVLSGACHTTDLICQFAGYRPSAAYARGTAGEPSPPGYEPEPLLDGMIIDFESGITGVHVGPGGEYGWYYCEVVGTKGTVLAGLLPPPRLRTPHGEELDLTPRLGHEVRGVFAAAYDDITDYLDGGPLPSCTNDDFVVVNEIGFAAVESIHTNERVTVPNRRRGRKVFADG